MTSLPARASASRPALVTAAVALLALVSFFWFPGHTILQSDTQIYIPILQHLEDPSVLANDIMAVRPHLSYSLYDEIALALRRTTGVSFETVLLAQLFLYRAAGIWGLYLLGTGAGFGMAPSLVLAALVSLGAAVNGPMVLTVEYEPVPRAFAMPFLLLSMGALAHGRALFAAGAATAGFALHPPTVLTYCGLLGALLLWRREWRALGVLMAGPVLLVLPLAGQPPSPEQPPLFARIDPALERLQRMRAPYNWVSLWIGRCWAHYAILTALFVVAYGRVRDLLPWTLRGILLALPVAGWVSLPVAWFCLEQWKWTLIPQYQPARHLLFITLFAVVACSMAAVWAGIRRRYAEAFLFALAPLLVPQEKDLASARWDHLALAAGLALVLALSMRSRRTALAAALLPALLIPTLGGVENAPRLDTADLDQLASWAKKSTEPGAVFQFADAGRQITPGIFRARARRALFADWKAGGQVNFLPSFGEIWGKRWAEVSRARALSEYAALGIDYVVYSARNAPAGVPPVYSNRGWVVFRTRQ